MLLGIDVGTTSTKALLYDPERGRVVAESRHPTPTHFPRPGWSEFRAEELWDATAAAVRELMEADGGAAIEAVAVASMAEAGVPLDANDRPTAPMITWYDLRTEPQVAWWRRTLDPFRIYAITGQILEAKYSLNKLLWLREHAPEAFARTRRWLCVQDLVLWKLSDEFATDYTLASRTLAFDQQRLDWSDEMLEHAGMPRALFPTAFPSGTQVGRVSPAAALATGLRPGTAVVTAGHDHLVGALAAGLVRAGGLLDSTGTSAVVMLIADGFHPRRRLFEAGISTYAHVVPDTYVAFGGLNAAGGAVEWLVRHLWGSAEYEQAFREAAEAPAGAGGALWLPHFLGSGTPRNDEQSRAALVGVRPNLGRGHLLRALLEGLAYWTRENLDVLGAELGLAADEAIVAIGGATRSRSWSQLKADVYGRAVRVSRAGESVALGAALLAGIGCGRFADAAAAVASLRAEEETFRPAAATSAAYSARYRALYLPLYAALREVNLAIDAFEPG